MNETAANGLDATVNPREVEHYRRLANLWWDQSGPFWPLHRLNALRVDYLAGRLIDPARASEARPLEGITVLDIGCGGGILSESMARIGASVTGIDVVEKNIAIASEHARSSALDIEYRVATASALREEGRTYDIVLNMEVVEHVADPGMFMADCCDLVRGGGRMTVATINRTARSFVFAIVGAEYVLRWLPRGTHHWKDFVTPEELCSMTAANGLQLAHQSGVWVNPVTREFSLCKSMQVNYMMIFDKR